VKKFLIFGLIALLFAGCESNMLQTISEGMTRDQVILILGKPIKETKMKKSTVMLYGNVFNRKSKIKGEQNYLIQLKDGKVHSHGLASAYTE